MVVQLFSLILNIVFQLLSIITKIWSIIPKPILKIIPSLIVFCLIFTIAVDFGVDPNWAFMVAVAGIYGTVKIIGNVNII